MNLDLFRALQGNRCYFATYKQGETPYKYRVRFNLKQRFGHHGTLKV